MWNSLQVDIHNQSHKKEVRSSIETYLKTGMIFMRLDRVPKL